MKDFKTSSLSVIQVIELKAPAQASKVLVAGLHNLFDPVPQRVVVS